MSLWTKIRKPLAAAATFGVMPATLAAAGGLLGNKQNPDTSASDTLANLYQSQWNDYLARFAPLEDMQIQQMSPAANAKERQSAIDAVTGKYQNAMGDVQRRANNFGINLTPEELQSYKQRSNTQQALDSTTAYNRTMTVQNDRAYGVLPSFAIGGVGQSGMAGMGGAK